MVNPFICGSFNSKDEDDFEALMNPCSTPKRSKRMLSRTRSSNPYADRGLDKFSALLADLEDKKQKIYSQNRPHDISIVRFVFSPHSNDVKPIVVKLKDKKQATNDAEDKKTYEKTSDKELEMESKRRLKKSISGNLKLENLRKPWFYLPLTIILILVFLAIYGRSFAIMCTSIGWYLIPRIRETSSSRKPKRKYSEKNIVNEGSTSPTSVMNGPVDNKLPAAKHEHTKSW